MHPPSATVAVLGGKYDIEHIFCTTGVCRRSTVAITRSSTGGNATTKRCVDVYIVVVSTMYSSLYAHHTDYVDVSRKLIDTLTDAINIDMQGGEEKEVRVCVSYMCSSVTHHHCTPTQSCGERQILPRTLSSSGSPSGAMPQMLWAMIHTPKSKVLCATACVVQPPCAHSPPHTTATIQELGEFYRRNGQRARLPQEVGQSLLDRLGVAAAALPEKERSLLDKLLR